MPLISLSFLDVYGWCNHNAELQTFSFKNFACVRACVHWCHFYGDNLLSLATLDDSQKIEMILSLLHGQNWPRQVVLSLSHVDIPGFVTGGIALNFANGNTA